VTGAGRRRGAADGLEGCLAQDLHGIEVKAMRAITRIGALALLAVAAAACLLAAPAARAAVAICQSPADVPTQLLTSINTCFNCKVATPPACPANQHQACYEFPDNPTEPICDQIADAEVKACLKAVDDAASCNDALNTANATAETATCQTLPDPGDQKTCADDVATELAALSQSVQSAVTTGQQACKDLRSSVRATCLGTTF
jgi:hypothetical protein